ncbi:MAG: hypothetical protein QM796_01335 [Chthoniobacteraceae bacterium]
MIKGLSAGLAIFVTLWAPAKADDDWFLAGGINGASIASQPVFFMRLGDTLQLHIAVKTSAEHLASTAPQIQLGNHSPSTTFTPDLQVDWQWIRPDLHPYNNLRIEAKGDPIQYRLVSFRTSRAAKSPLLPTKQELSC